MLNTKEELWVKRQVMAEGRGASSAASAGYGADIIIIPADPRYPLDKKPLVTSAMKAECIAEFTLQREATCGPCFLGKDEPDGSCEICHGTGEYVETITVPWDTCKEIYKAMATAAARGLRVAP